MKILFALAALIMISCNPMGGTIDPLSIPTKPMLEGLYQYRNMINANSISEYTFVPSESKFSADFYSNGLLRCVEKGYFRYNEPLGSAIPTQKGGV